MSPVIIPAACSTNCSGLLGDLMTDPLDQILEFAPL
jgi:hypothetical protein